MRSIALAFGTMCLLATPGALAAPPPPPAPVPVPAAPVKADKALETLVDVRVRVVQVSTRAARSLRLLETSPRWGGPSTCDTAALTRRLECWTQAGHATALAEPRVLALPGQSASVKLGQDISYVKDYDVETGMATPVVANPVIGTVFEGWSFDCVAALAAGGVSLDATLTMFELIRPIPVWETTLPAGTGVKVQIQLPELRWRPVARRLVLTPGRAALLGAIPHLSGEWGDRSVLAWIEAHAVVAPAPAKAAPPVADKVR